MGLRTVWFKRDVRTRDHVPWANALADCAQTGDALLLLFIWEPEMLAHPTTSSRHLRFQWEGIQTVNARLAQEGIDLRIHSVRAPCMEVFPWLKAHHALTHLYSHEETGLLYSYERDLSVARWCKANHVSWEETPQLGVQRGLQTRQRWRYRWHRNMRQAMVHPPFGEWTKSRAPSWSDEWPTEWNVDGPCAPVHNQDLLGTGPFQKGGETQAQRYLTTFLEGNRIAQYQQNISRPLESRQSCSRLSPYLAWGHISMRAVFQSLEACESRTTNHRAFGSRLRWHCHFIQKFESEHRIEQENMNRGYDHLPTTSDAEHLERWRVGKTGIPFVDACMRCVRETGYLNFRMRAMLVSFLTHHMNHRWVDGVQHLARCFLDFEPGIHYSQFQMQAGVTGINTLRIYNPVKQGLDHDVEGHFIRRWLPELRTFPDHALHEPWRLPPLEAAMGQWEYAAMGPLLNVKEAARAARARLWSFKSRDDVKGEAKRIVRKHVDPAHRRRSRNRA